MASVLEKTEKISGKTKILSSAETVLLKTFSRATMDEIAKNAGLIKPLLIIILKNKDEILKVLISNYMEM